MDVIAERSLRQHAINDKLDDWIEQYAGQEDKQIAALSIEIRGASRLRSLLGNELGESLLKDVHQTIIEAVRDSDEVLVLSDTEILVLLYGIRNSGHALLAVRKLQHIMQNHTASRNNTVYLKPVIGIAMWPGVARSGDDLVRLSSLALDSAKEHDEEYSFYTVGKNDAKLFYWNIDAEASRAIENDEFVLHYQPQILLISGAVVGAEALVRWNHPVHGFLSPGQFIPLIERSETIHAFTRWCLHNALRHLVEWSSVPCPPAVSVNISSRNFRDPSFREVIANALGLWNVPPQRLTLEITEGALIDDMAYTTAVLNALRELGVRISIDDFGTGYSSLAYLKQLPVDELKIDQSFVKNLLTERHDRNIVETIMKIATDFEFDVVAEGIEDKEVMSLLSDMGCELGQGYAISHPIPESEFYQLLQRQAPGC